MKTSLKISIIVLFSVLVFLVSSAIFSKTTYYYLKPGYTKIEVTEYFFQFSGELDSESWRYIKIEQKKNYYLGAIFGISTCLILMVVLHQRTFKNHK